MYRFWYRRYFLDVLLYISVTFFWKSQDFIMRYSDDDVIQSCLVFVKALMR